MSGAEQPKPMTREALRLQVLSLSASLNSPSRSLDTIMETADKAWAWIEGEGKPASKTTMAVARSVARLKEGEKV